MAKNYKNETSKNAQTPSNPEYTSKNVKNSTQNAAKNAAAKSSNSKNMGTSDSYGSQDCYR